ncbi:hypothetical protein [Leisingera sp. JC11]|uniref:hypothetical protein n=1 Tax=Leisingera sp. JC11 TaxID=3042469 RepID=UPI0034516C59
MAKIFINAADGIVDIEADSDSLSDVTDHALRLLETIQSVAGANLVGTPEPVGQTVDEVATDEATIAPNPEPTKKKRRSKGGGKTKNWKVVPEFLTDDQWKSVKDFYFEKAPNTQNEQVAVLCYTLSEQSNSTAFDGHEIHTAFQSVGVKTPANLAGVFGNMTGAGLGRQVDGKFELMFRGKELVQHELPRQVKLNA